MDLKENQRGFVQDFKFPYKVDKKGPRGTSIGSWLDIDKHYAWVTDTETVLKNL